MHCLLNKGVKILNAKTQAVKAKGKKVFKPWLVYRARVDLDGVLAPRCHVERAP
jgi:hypothetical protein